MHLVSHQWEWRDSSSSLYRSSLFSPLSIYSQLTIMHISLLKDLSRDLTSPPIIKKPKTTTEQLDTFTYKSCGKSKMKQLNYSLLFATSQIRASSERWQVWSQFLSKGTPKCEEKQNKQQSVYPGWASRNCNKVLEKEQS